MAGDEGHRIEEFWVWFVAHQMEFSSLSSQDEPFWDQALEQLKSVDEHLWFELSRHRHPARELIMTVEGHVDSFPTVERLVRFAPEIEGWSFVALKPAHGFDFITTYEGTDFDPRRMWFLPLERTSHPNVFGIRVAVPGFDRTDPKNAHTAVLVILDTALGERSAALDVHYTEVAEMPTDPASQGYIELFKLADYIARRKRRLASPSA
jgi:hypothetical protein